MLLYNNPISFHKFWQIDPYYVYRNWLLERDETNENNKYQNPIDSYNYCSKNQNEFCYGNIHDGND